MEELLEEVRQEQWQRLRRRLEALDLMELKLRQMRELAVYAAERNLRDYERVQIQQWMDALQREVRELDRATVYVLPEKGN